MERKFHYTAPAKPMPVVFEQVFAEKPAGGVIPNPAHDIMPGTALDASGKPIKAYRLTKAVGSSDTTIQIEKGSGIASGDIIGHGKKAVASTKVDTSNPNYDIVTVTMGVEIAIGTVLYPQVPIRPNPSISRRISSVLPHTQERETKRFALSTAQICVRKLLLSPRR